MQNPEAPSIAVVVLVEPGYLEWQSVLLISSLRAFCYDTYKIYAYCRSDRINAIQTGTREFLQENGVTLRGFDNPFEDGYPQGNKFLACADEREEKATVFLDTDTFICRPLNFGEILKPNALCVVPVRKKTWSEDIRDWEHLYKAFGEELPNNRIRLARSKEIWVPYFNGGMIAYSQPEFGAAWKETAIEINRMIGYPSFRPWLDQVSLSIAAKRQNLEFEVLDMAWNDTPHTHDHQTRVLHYHTWTWLKEFYGLSLPSQVVSVFSKYSNARDVVQKLGTAKNVP